MAGRWALPRWFAASATLSVPQAAGPVAFSLLALQLTGDASLGAALILAMTLAQVAGAIPLSRLGSGWPPHVALRRLILVRTAGLGLLALLAGGGAPFPWLVLAAAITGAVHGAAFGFLRTVLNQLTPAERLPRALGIAATLNEVTFVLAPVLASLLGSVSPVLGVVALAGLGALPALLVPRGGARSGGALPPASAAPSPAIALWLLCAAAGGAAVAAIEIGAVALALRFGHPPALAILFTVPLCLAAVAGGLWVSWRNRRPGRALVVAQLGLMTLGAGLVALNLSMAVTVLGAVLVGAVLAPLGTHYSLTLDALAPPHRRAELFALLRTANSLGVILASALLTAGSLSLALAAIAALIAGVTLVVAFATLRRPPPA